MSSAGRPVPTGGESRPPHVVMAAVAGFVEAVLLLLAALAYFTFSAVGPLLVAIGALFLVLSLACALGSVRALQGRDRTVLVAAAGSATALALVLIASSVANGSGFDAFSASVVLLGVAPVVLLLQPPSREWFAERRTR